LELLQCIYFQNTGFCWISSKIPARLV